MRETRVLDDDIVRFYELGKKRTKKDVLTLFWGDTITVVTEGRRSYAEIQRRKRDEKTGKLKRGKFKYVIPPKARFRDTRLLKVRFVDVGQGDGAVIEPPTGELILVDGGLGENILRYIRTAYAHVLHKGPLHCDAIVVTHGDADHFAGLAALVEGLNEKDEPGITADRIFHNGLVKAEKKPRMSDTAMFGKSVKLDGITYAVDLESDIRRVPDSRMNKPFKKWKAAIAGLRSRKGRPTVKRIEYGDGDAFDFVQSDQLVVDVLGPVVENVRGRPALPFLHTPGKSGLSASHTINGHSIVLKLRYRNVRLLFGADLNEESENSLLERARRDGVSLTSEVLKVPHHGSADFSPNMLDAVRPVVSVVSSGDETTAQEYIHPRAGLVGALGKYSRPTVPRPLVYVTEMVAFFEKLGPIVARKFLPGTGKEGKKLGNFDYGYNKKRFGIVHVRTDGERVLVVTHSGKDDQKESYVFHVDDKGEITFDEKARIV